MDEKYISDYEMLYRAVLKSNPSVYVNGKPTAALFMDDKGVSVERDGERSEEEIVETLTQRFRKNQGYENAVKIRAGVCREIGTYPNPVGNKKNKFHAEIHESEKIIPISILKALRLAKECEIVKPMDSESKKEKTEQ